MSYRWVVRSLAHKTALFQNQGPKAMGIWKVSEALG